MARGLHVLIALVTLTSLASAGRGYLYCHMMGSAMASCCCAKSAHAVSAEKSESELVARPCCEWRDHEGVTSDALANVDNQTRLIASPREAVAFLELPRLALALKTHVVPFGSPRAPPAARGSPGTSGRSGKVRARLGVMIC